MKAEHISTVERTLSAAGPDLWEGADDAGEPAAAVFRMMLMVLQRAGYDLELVRRDRPLAEVIDVPVAVFDFKGLLVSPVPETGPILVGGAPIHHLLDMLRNERVRIRIEKLEVIA